MSTIFMWGAAFILGLILLDKIPGVKHLIKPVIDLLSFVFTTFFGNVGAWLLWLVKTIGRSHYVLAVHLGKHRDDLDPTEAIKKANKRGGVPQQE
jgi:hypothetical protein